jgi:tRNA-specific 2-thiouridylase
MKKKVVIGLSGGVDSSIAAFKLQEQGFDVEALFMINWKDASVTIRGDCTWEEDLVVAKLVAKKLNIPLHVVDSSEQYMQKVADYMFAEYQKGRTPNPDVLCNREIKFDVFLDRVKEIGADYFATGHYAKKESIRKNGKTYYRLLAGDDKNKDQSYFLCQLSQSQLEKALFPIGDIEKPEVRKIAAKLDLASAYRKDSQGLCFIGKVDLPTFLQQKLAPKEGNIVLIPHKKIVDENLLAKDIKDEEERIKTLCQGRTFAAGDGKIVGTHKGAHYFTIGQRRGLNVGGMKAPLFVIATDVSENIIYVGMGKEHPGLYRQGLFIPHEDLHWVRPDMEMQIGEKRNYLSRIRYRQALVEAQLYRYEDGMYITFTEAQRGITSGQFAAWYDDNELIGSGVIY